MYCLSLIHILARFRELEIFTQFSSDLDPATQKTLDHGKRLLELLKQPLYQPMPVSRQAVLLYIGTNGLLDEVPVEQVRDFAVQFVDRMEHQYVAVSYTHLPYPLWPSAISP